MQCIAIAHRVDYGHTTFVNIVEVITSMKKVKELRFKGKYQVNTKEADPSVALLPRHINHRKDGFILQVDREYLSFPLPKRDDFICRDVLSFSGRKQVGNYLISCVFLTETYFKLIKVSQEEMNKAIESSLFRMTYGVSAKAATTVDKKGVPENCF